MKGNFIKKDQNTSSVGTPSGTRSNLRSGTVLVALAKQRAKAFTDRLTNWLTPLAVTKEHQAGQIPKMPKA